MNSPDSISTPALAGGEKTTFRARIPKYTIRFLAILGIALLLWKVLTVSVLESRHEDAMQALRDSTTQRIDDRTSILAHAAGEGAGMALLAPLRSGDLAAVRTVAAELGRRLAVTEYIVADPSGTIIAATSSNLEGGTLDTNLGRVAASLDAPVVDRTESGLTRVVVPLRGESPQGESTRAGTLILSFRFS